MIRPFLGFGFKLARLYDTEYDDGNFAGYPESRVSDSRQALGVQGAAGAVFNLTRGVGFRLMAAYDLPLIQNDIAEENVFRPYNKRPLLSATLLLRRVRNND